MGGGQPIGGSILIDRRPAHQRQHRVTRPLGIRKPLQHQHRRPLGEPRPISGGRERLAPSIGGQPPLPAELHKNRRGGHHRHSAGQRQITLAQPQ